MDRRKGEFMLHAVKPLYERGCMPITQKFEQERRIINGSFLLSVNKANKAVSVLDSMPKATTERAASLCYILAHALIAYLIPIVFPIMYGCSCHSNK